MPDDDVPAASRRSVGGAFGKVLPQTMDVAPLTTFRAHVAGLRDALRAAPRPAWGPDTGARRELALDVELADAALMRVEEQAHHLMRACMAQHRLPPLPPLRAERMTAAGPVPLRAEELAALGPPVEPYPCERVRVVSQSLIDDIQRYVRALHQLRTEDFGWARRAEQERLRREVQRLEALLFADDPLRGHRAGPPRAPPRQGMR